LSASIEQLVNSVAPSVVQVKVSAYRPVEGDKNDDTSVIIGRESAIGSGAIISADGYIVTNAHVVNGAQRVQVVLRGARADDQLNQFLLGAGERTVEARIVGTSQDLDLALIKIDATGLRPIPLADYHTIHQGELVFAFGSPEALRDSVTMGVVSAVARQPDPDSPAVYIQTDAPINPGNSGGPLVNVDGELVGVNTFILSESGGSQGLGFAIPSVVVAAAYPDLRKYGRLRRGVLGVEIQANSPELATGLRLAQNSGVLVADVLPDSPAEDAGLKPQDLVMQINGTPTPTVPMFGLEMLGHKPGETVKLDILRGRSKLSLMVDVVEESETPGGLTTLANPATDSVPQLGIVGVDITEDTAKLLPDLRIPTGVFVAARSEASQVAENPLTTGDIVHAVNDLTVRSLDGLRVILDGLKPNTSVVLQIERDGHLRFVVMRLEQ
jgi:serine protease Do